MKKSLIMMLLLVAALALGLAACGGSDAGPPDEGSGYEAEPGVIGDGSEESRYPEVREDEDGLVTIRFEDGIAEIIFNLEKWGDLNIGMTDLDEGPFPIETSSGRVVDAIVGKIVSVELFRGRDYLAPVVALLMEDGRVEYFIADPTIGQRANRYHSLGVLPWLEDITSFTYEPAGGEGEMTIYAWDSKGLKYDITLVNDLVNIFHSWGVWEFFIKDKYDNELKCAMVLTEDGEMDITIGRKIDNWSYETEQTYSGSYEVFLAENGEREAGLMDIDLERTWWIAELDGNSSAADQEYWDERMKITGTYYFWTEGDGYLNLDLRDGDALMHTGWRGEPVQSYNFWLTMFSGYG